MNRSYCLNVFTVLTCLSHLLTLYRNMATARSVYHCRCAQFHIHVVLLQFWNHIQLLLRWKLWTISPAHSQRFKFNNFDLITAWEFRFANPFLVIPQILDISFNIYVSSNWMLNSNKEYWYFSKNYSDLKNLQLIKNSNGFFPLKIWSKNVEPEKCINVFCSVLW